MKTSESKFIRKSTGAFYTPPNLASYVASKMSKLFPKKHSITILDPAVGDGALLLAFQPFANSKQVLFAGVDINEDAIESTSEKMKRKNLSTHLFCTDTLSPYNLDLKSGWNKIKERLNIDFFDAIISNPPWGADFDKSDSATSVLSTAIGQYDIYDLFLELSIELLSEGGVYGFIIPDSIYRKEHYSIRKKLLSETTIKFIARIGEFIFDGVSTSVSVVIGYKSKPSNENICSCVHFPNKIAKLIAANKMSFSAAEKGIVHPCKQQFFIDSDFALSIDVAQSDLDIIDILDSSPTVGQYLSSHRGVELSKKGNVVQCPKCQYWMPMPKNGTLQYKCNHCKNAFIIDSAVSDIIISKNIPEDNNSAPFLSGEDLERYFYQSKSRIRYNFEGINYKNLSIYNQPKILVRKTGVGITAVLDYHNHIVNQVVYLLTPKTCAQHIPIEFFIAVINSRIITYYIIKKYGLANWCTHPYLSQTMVEKLPIPDFHSFTVNEWECVNRISVLVKQIYSTQLINNDTDIEIEKKLLTLFNINESSFLDMLNAIESVEQMIPFKRLLKIPKEAWATVI